MAPTEPILADPRHASAVIANAMGIFANFNLTLIISLMSPVSLMPPPFWWLKKLE